jgi:chitinase
MKRSWLLVPLAGAVLSCQERQLPTTAGELTGTDHVTVSVLDVNRPPVADAGDDQTALEGQFVTLNGLGSFDPDGDALMFAWVQTEGPAVTLSDPTAPQPTFTAPLVGPSGATLVFQLTVSDGGGGTDTDHVTVTVLDANAPPSCENAQPTPAVLSPPTRQFVAVTIAGVVDPDGEAVTISITGVRQDEPVKGGADGNTSPDAVLQGSSVLLRAERSASGTGRAYHVAFTATEDVNGGSCSGTVKVIVPHHHGSEVVDEGPLFSSTTP